MSLCVTQFLVGGFDHNFSYLITNLNESSSYIVDPSGDMAALFTHIEARALSVQGVILTHTHHDHFDSLAETIAQFSEVPIYVHERGIDAVGEYPSLLALTDYEELSLGNVPLRILHTPGHSDDSICLYIEDKHSKDGVPQLISGDTLFVGGCGRSSAHQVKDLYESLCELKALPPETVVYPGHDYGTIPTSTIGRELTENRFYQVGNFNEFKHLRLG